MRAPVSLQLFLGDQLLSEQRFTDNIIKIGRVDTAHLKLGDDPTIARVHAVLEAHENGELTLIDLGSEVGTTINDVKVQKGPLRAGDRIRIAGYTIVVARPTSERPSATPGPETARDRSGAISGIGFGDIRAASQELTTRELDIRLTQRSHTRWIVLLLVLLAAMGAGGALVYLTVLK